MMVEEGEAFIGERHRHQSQLMQDDQTGLVSQLVRA